VEALSSGQAIARHASEIMAAQPAIETSLRIISGHDSMTLTAKAVTEEAAAGDNLATKVLREAGEALGRGIACAISLMNPDRVVLGGGVTKAGARYLRWVRDETRLNLLSALTADIVLSALGDEAPLWGALALAETQLTEG
jgi:glucokinase